MARGKGAVVIGATLFSGIGAPEVACREIDWRWAAEVEKFPSAVLGARHPSIHNLGDVTADDFTDRARSIAAPDILVFGSPCQSFSVAGKRLGLDDPRGNLALVALNIARALRPRWLVFENVPGLLSSDEGRDFGLFLRALEDSGYLGCWRVLDAQYFGLAQRRRRVFLVGHLGDWRPPAAVLFERQSLSRDPAPRREPGTAVAALTADGVGTCGADDNQAQAGHLIVAGVDDQLVAFGGNDTRGPIEVAPAVRAKGGSGHGDFESEAFVVSFKPAHYTRGKDGAPSDLYPPLSADADKGDQDPVVLAFSCKDHAADLGPVSPTLRAMGHGDSHANGGGQIAVTDGLRVRRITPREAERLQGFPDDYTLIDYRGKPAADGPRYKALGNSMAVPVMRWILTRVLDVDALLKSEAA